MSRFLFALALAAGFGLVLAPAPGFAKHKPAAAASTKACKAKAGGKTLKWSCGADQACCVTPDGKGVCGLTGLGCL